MDGEQNFSCTGLVNVERVPHGNLHWDASLYTEAPSLDNFCMSVCKTNIFYVEIKSPVREAVVCTTSLGMFSMEQRS